MVVLEQLWDYGLNFICGIVMLHVDASGSAIIEFKE